MTALLSKHVTRSSASLMNGELQTKAPAKCSPTPTEVLSNERRAGDKNVKLRTPVVGGGMQHGVITMENILVGYQKAIHRNTI